MGTATRVMVPAQASDEPETVHAITVDNLAGVDQRVDVQSDDAFMHTLEVASSSDDLIIVGVKSDRSLSAVVAATIGTGAVVELDNGNLVSAEVTVDAGGTLAGNGTVVGTLILGSGSGPTAMIKPGFSLGHLDVEGDYEQGANGALLIEVEGTMVDVTMNP